MIRPRSLVALSVAAVALSLGIALALEPVIFGSPVHWALFARTPAAVPPPPAAAAPAPSADEENWNELTRTLATQAVSYRGRVGIYLRDLKHDRTWTYHADDLFPSASLIKVPIMCAVFEKIREGDLTLGTRLVLRRRERFGGSGTLKWYPDRSKFTVRELLEHLMVESDNTAMKMLIDAIGFGFLQEQFQKIGLTYTQIHPSGLSLAAGKVATENYTTAHEMAGLLEKIHDGVMVDRFSSEMMVELMKKKKPRRRLAQNLPVGWEIAHKTGLLRRACHDVAIVTSPDGEFIIAVLTGQNRDYKRAKAFIAKVGRTVYTYYGHDTATARAGHRIARGA